MSLTPFPHRAFQKALAYSPELGLARLCASGTVCGGAEAVRFI